MLAPLVKKSAICYLLQKKSGPGVFITKKLTYSRTGLQIWGGEQFKSL